MWIGTLAARVGEGEDEQGEADEVGEDEHV